MKFWGNGTGDQRSLAVKKNALFSLVIKGCSILISLLLVPLTLGFVTDELYGIWLTLSSVLFWLTFFDIGFTQGLKNKLTEAIALDNWERARSLVSTTYFVMVVLFLPLCLLLELVIPYVDWAMILNVDSSYNPELKQVLHILVACFSVQMIVNVLTSVVAAFQQVSLSASFPMIGNFIALILIWILSYVSNSSLLLLSLVMSVSPVFVSMVASFVLYSGRYKKVAPSVKAIRLEYVRDLWGLGAKFFLIQIQVLILYQCTNLLISNLSGPDQVTTYNIAYRYLSVSMMLYSILLSPLWPAFTDAYVKKDFAWMNRVYRRMCKVYLMSVVLLFLLVVFSPFVYQIWIGDKVEIPWEMTVLVALYMAIHSWDLLQVELINGVGAVKLQTYVTLVGLFLYIPLAFLIGRYWGALGVVSSMIVINIVYVSCFTTQVHKLLTQKAQGIWLK